MSDPTNDEGRFQPALHQDNQSAVSVATQPAAAKRVRLHKLHEARRQQIAEWIEGIAARWRDEQRALTDVGVRGRGQNALPMLRAIAGGPAHG